MALISKISPPSGNEYDIRASAIPSGEVDSTSTSTVFTATVPGVTELTEGVCVFLRNGVVTSASGFTLNVNGLGAKPCYNNLATGYGTTNPTRDTTIFNINYTMLFIYSQDIVDGGGWICYRGYDSNSNTIGYQVRTNSSTLHASDQFYRYRLLFTSANGTKWVPANTSSSTNATAKRTTNTRPINPFGPIVYYSSTTAISANSNPGATSLWQQYTLSLGYSFNNTGAALTMSYPAPVYLRCTPQTNGSATMDYFTQSLPSTEDGKIYIFLGRAYSATSIELTIDHPVFYHDGNGIKLWTGTKIPSKTSDLTNDSGFITSADVPEGSVASTTTPKMDGTAAVGTESAFARGDHVHPTDTSRASTATFSTSANGLVPKPSSAATNSYLNSSGTWTTPPNTTYALATTAANGLLSNQMYSLLENNAIGADESSIDGINAVNGYQIHLSLANLQGDDYILEDYATIPPATTATYGVVKPNGTASHYLNGTGGWTAPPNTTYSTFSTSSDGLVPHPSAASTASLLNSSGTWTALPSSVSEFTNDAGYITGMTILSYGQSTLQDFQAAYQANKVVYARASSNANPASGDQTRLAFMAYVNNATTPSCVEFQYYRSVSSHTSTQQGDQVFVYTLKNTGWTVTTREASVKVVAGSNMLSTYSNNTITLNPSLATTAAAGIVKPDGTTITVDGNGVISASGGSTPLTGTTATLTPTQVKTALRAGTDICLEYHGAFDQIPVDFRFTSWNGATDDLSGAALDAVVSNTIVYYNNNYYLFDLTGIIASEGTTLNSWFLHSTNLGGGSGGFTYIAEDSTYGSVKLGAVQTLTASGTNSVAQGSFSAAVGDYSHAEGNESSAYGSGSHAEGILTHANGSGSHAQGETTNVIDEGRAAHAEGRGTYATSTASHAEGQSTTASGLYSHSEGWNTLASTGSAHAEGDATTASGYASHAQGNLNLASGEQAFVSGYQSTASHRNSIAVGMNVRTSHNEQAVFGAFNADDSTALLLVGNGASTASADRKNALTVHTDGRVTAGANATGLKDLVTLDQLVPVGSIIRNNISDENTMNTLYPNMTWVRKYGLFNGEQDWPSSDNTSGSYKEIIVPGYMGVAGTGTSNGFNFVITIPGLKDSGITVNDLDVWADGNTGVIGRFIETKRYYIYKKKSGVVPFTIKYVDGDNVGLCTGSTANFTITDNTNGSGTALANHHGGTCWLYASENNPSISFEISSSYDLGMYIWKRTG